MARMENLMRRVVVASIVASALGVAYSLLGGSQAAPPPSRESRPPRKETPPSAAKGGEADLSALDAVAASAWSRLRAARIYFAHQSVGSNILRGVERIARTRPGSVPEVRSASDLGSGATSPGLRHGPAGKNGDPLAKIEAFERTLSGPEGASQDVALLKLCYADIGRATDVDALFESYAATVARIERVRPGLRIVHCTVPLRTTEQGAKAAVKRLVGNGSGAANAARGRFNDLIRARFPAERIFDIARAESRCPGGDEAFEASAGVRWPALCAEYSRDGGHLNELGQEVLARELLLALARNAPAARPSQAGRAASAEEAHDVR